MSNRTYTKWVACFGNATSITDRKECVYSKNLTLRYPVKMCFYGSKLRFRFSNETGTEPVVITRATVARSAGAREIDPDTLAYITKDGSKRMVIEPGCELTSDAIDFSVERGETLQVSIYLAECTQMNSGTLITGPLSKGFYAYGDFADSAELDDDLTRNTNWYYFLNTIDVFTEEQNKALICYGDSITAQSWPDYLTLRLEKEGIENVSVIRRAISGTKILRQYDCITYQAYGKKGEKRFPVEVNTTGAYAVLIQHGINDIIHPVGVEVNRFRPWSDLPTVDEMIEGTKKFYIEEARKRGLKVYAGTLVPIWNWRTYEEFRNDMRNAFNEWLRNSDLFDGVADFDEAIRDPEFPKAFGPGFDSGDHLHPSEAAYQAMAYAIPENWLQMIPRREWIEEGLGNNWGEGFLRAHWKKFDEYVLFGRLDLILFKGSSASGS